MLSSNASKKKARKYSPSSSRDGYRTTYLHDPKVGYSGNEQHAIAQAYADQFFDFLEPLKADQNFQHLVERNQYLCSCTDERVDRLREALIREDAKGVYRSAQELFDSMGRIGDVRMMRVCYRIIMQGRCGNLKAARRILDDLEIQYERLRKQVFGFQLH